MSTGVDLGEEFRCLDGVAVPGVAGGVKAGDTRSSGRPGVVGPEGCRSSHCEKNCADGRACGASKGEAWEGRSVDMSAGIWVK